MARTAGFQVGESFQVQFAWRLPESGYLRAVFTARVLDLVPEADKYVVQLTELIAGREEDMMGEMRPKEDFSADYWRLVGRLIGRKLTLAYEADDGRALYLRLETLTGEHNFFTRYEDAEVVARGLSAAHRAGETKR
jgi:hypothetical protein